ncbi:Mob1 [Coleophoma crateriformis]|uniref:Mob1 n=1 Tax=Coleophoma crateriformis TaxID=565419 RepID=A0A3D8T110_9HELO|nr:Mob1 [Coleophoma crateriformis]
MASTPVSTEGIGSDGVPRTTPRLPSPPPPTEIQIGARSPSLGNFSNTQDTSIEQAISDANASRRIHPGTKSADMAAGPPLIPLSELDSAFQLQEHLKALHFYYSKPSSSTHTIPISRETASLITTQPEGIDRALWLYELCRFLINKCNDLIIGFLFDDPPCSATTCPEMRASEWQFLCAVHDSPKSCCAIDYCCHTLDWATNIVTSQKIFPSRLSLGAGDAVDDRGAGIKHLVNIFRRLHRIFAHAWFQHREVFWAVESQTGLYVLFKTVCDEYELLPAENYKLPPEAEGLDPVEESKSHISSIYRSEPSKSNPVTSIEEDFMGVGRTNTRRHIRQSPSVGSAVTTVLESDEEDHQGDVTQKLGKLHLAEEEEHEDDTTEVPVIVETYEVDNLEAEGIEDRLETQPTVEPKSCHEQGSTEAMPESIIEETEEGLERPAVESGDESTRAEPAVDGAIADKSKQDLPRESISEKFTDIQKTAQIKEA